MTDYETIQKYLVLGDFIEAFRDRDTYSIGGLSSPTLLIKGAEGIRALHQLAKKIHKEKEIGSNYTNKQVLQELERQILHFFEGEKVSESKLIQKIKTELTSKAKEEYEIVRKIFGVKFSRYKIIGPFGFYKGGNTSRRMSIPTDKLKLLKVDLSGNVVSIKVKSITTQRAVELADEVFVALEYLFAFLHGRKKGYFEVRVIRPSAHNFLHYIAKTKNRNISIGMGHTALAMDEINLDEDFFNENDVRRLFEIIGNGPKNKIEKRIYNAVTWIGKGQLADSSMEAILNYCSALESLLIREEKSIINPSIIASLSEYCAFLLVNSKEHRLEMVKKIKELYSKRSAGTHGGKLGPDSDLESYALQLSRAMVFRLLELYPAKLKNDNDIFDYINDLKFSIKT